jgi:RND family efflux transporter MFP subunit
MNYIKNMNTLQKTFALPLLAFLIALPLFLSGCGEDTKENNTENNIAQENEETQKSEDAEKKIPSVETIILSAESFAPTVEVSGTLLANEEINISAEASGTVDKVLKKEGDKVTEGDAILELDEGNTLTLSAYNAAAIAIENARVSLDLQKDAAERDIENALIASEQAKENYLREKRSKKSLKESLDAQSANAKTQKEISEKNLEVKKIALEQTLENEKKIQKNILENTGNTLSQTLVNFRTSLTFSDELIGASDLNKNANDDFETYLIGTTLGVMVPTQDLWKKVNKSISATEESFRSFEKAEYTSADEEEMIRLAKVTVENAKELRILLRNVESMLQESIASQSFPQSKIDSLKATLTQYQNTLEANIAQISSAEQALSDFHIQSPQRITNAQMNVSVAESQLLSAESSLNNLLNSETTQKINIDSSLQQAKNNFRSALNAVKNMQTKAEMSIQGAKSQYDSANANLQQSQISLSKLTITSGIDGTITKILKKSGDTVSLGTPVVVVADYSKLKLKADVSIKERLLLEEGMKAAVQIEDINETLEGKISLISPEADKVTKRVSIEIEIPNEKNIPANIFSTATIEMPSEEKTLFIPSSSIVSYSPTTVFVAVKKEITEEKPENSESQANTQPQDMYIVEKREITLGREKDETGEKEVTSGLKEGDILITEKNKNIAEGDSISILTPQK